MNEKYLFRLIMFVIVIAMILSLVLSLTGIAISGYFLKELLIKGTI